MSFYMYMLLDMDMSSDMEPPTGNEPWPSTGSRSAATDERTIAMRYPNHFHKHTDRHDAHNGERHEGARHQRAHGRFHRGGTGHGPRCEQHGEQPRGGAHRRPTLERSIMKSARRIRRADLSPEQLHRRIAATVSHADYVTTMRTLRRIGMELRGASETSER